MFYNQKFGILREVVRCLGGSLAIALITLVCFCLKLQLPTAILLYLTVIVLLSLWGTFISAAVVSLLAGWGLVYFFAPPILSFKIEDPINAVAVFAFLTISFIITHLVSRVRQLMDEKLQRTEAYLAGTFPPARLSGLRKHFVFFNTYQPSGQRWTWFSNGFTRKMSTW
jgi:two-component system sensor histidine kinase KdpD